MQGKALPRLELFPGGSPLPKGGGRIETDYTARFPLSSRGSPLPKGGGRIETQLLMISFQP